ncbi:MAG: cytochrome c maturation protein CcmE [Kiloniellales bacterium]|nr:cytochrome c maturation protein CcmE [Kiloniellales bacterium]
MTRKRKRMIAVLAGLASVAVAAALVLSAFEENLLYFYSPSDLTSQEVPRDRPIRLGGLVAEDSIKRLDDGLTVQFVITDLAHQVAVTYKGILPDLFREGQGVIAEGRYSERGLIADEVLAKHDENYMPPEVAEALKKSGQWHEEDGHQ